MSPDVPTSHDSVPFFNVVSLSHSPSPVRVSSNHSLPLNTISPVSSSLPYDNFHYLLGSVRYILHDNFLVPAPQSAPLPPPEPFASLFDPSVSADIPSCKYIPQDSSPVPLLSSNSYVSKLKSSTHVLSTHPMISQSKYSLQALTTFCASANDLINRESHSVHEGLLSPHWTDAIKEELNALMDNHTWFIVPLPAGRIPIWCKCPFKIKRHANRSIARYKARLVAKGFSHKSGFEHQ